MKKNSISSPKTTSDNAPTVSSDKTPTVSHKDLYTKERQQRINDKNLEQELKKSFASWAKWTVSAYLIFIAIIILFNNFRVIGLSDAVLITLLSTTTVNIFGLSYVIVSSLFPKKDNKF